MTAVSIRKPVLIPVPAGSAHLDFERKCAALDRMERRDRLKRALMMTGAILCIPGTISGWLYRASFPLVIVEEKHIPYGPHNVPLAAFDNAADAAKDIDGDAALPSLWRFLRAMEQYDEGKENEDWHIATQMGSADISGWFRRDREVGRKDTRAGRYGARYTVRIERDSEIDACKASGCGKGISGYTMRYHRVVWDNQHAREVERIPYVSTLRFQRNVPGFTLDFIRQFNPMRVQVTHYTIGEPLAAVNTRFPTFVDFGKEGK